jgi:hypothetical protein
MNGQIELNIPRTWQTELRRFRAMSQEDQFFWSSQLLHLISMFARDTYEVGTEGVERPSSLRRFNELIHRVATFQKKIAKPGTQGMPDSDVFGLLEQELSSLGVDEEFLLDKLP